MSASSNIEKSVKNYYETLWSPPFKLKGREKNLLLGFHFGIYEKGVTNWKEAALKMNDYVGELLNINKSKTMNILDAGCGVGATSVHLALKYPNSHFTGIDLTPIEIKLAHQLQKQKQTHNTKFICGSYLKCDFKKNYFDAIFALESSCYAENKKRLIKEMNRLLKPGGKLVVIDGFRTGKPIGSFMKKAYCSFLKRRATPDLISINEFKELLTEYGFEDIAIHDHLNKGIIFNYLKNDFVKVILKGIKSQFKSSNINKEISSENIIDHIFVSLFSEFLLGMSQIIRYYSITAIKKSV